MAEKKSFFNMQMTETQREVLDRLIENDFPGMSVAGYMLFLIRLRAHQELNFDIEKDAFSFDLILELFKKEEAEKEERIKEMLGEEQYNKMIEEFEKKKNKNTKVEL